MATFLLEKNICRNCKHFKQLFDGGICRKHLMAVHGDMHVTYEKKEGSCWKRKRKETQ